MTTIAPFLYPFRRSEILAASRYARHLFATRKQSPLTTQSRSLKQQSVRLSTTTGSIRESDTATALPIQAELGRLNPGPNDYNIIPFVDKCVFTVQAGAGGHGCVSFLREKYVPEGPPNGGDGGTGGNVFIQAVKGCTSLNKLTRTTEYRAGRGQNGEGSSKGGKKGEDILLEVPVGTVVREIKRWDPVEVQMDLERQHKASKGLWEDVKSKMADRWLVYPGLKTSSIDYDALPRLPRARRATIAAMEPPSPIRLDLDEPMERPMLLAAGAVGGQGNSHFASNDHPRPKVATKGDAGKRIALTLELKLVADVGLVGLPNAGKSTLLRSVSNSRARVGSWAFTTLQPNIGTVILDDHKGRPTHVARTLPDGGKIRTRFSIADIPGIIEDAHLNRGLGLDFLRHIERAQILAFVVDLSSGNAVTALDALWREVGEYQALKDREELEYSQRTVHFNPFAGPGEDPFPSGVSFKDVESLPPLFLPPITAKPWFVIGTKADLPNTQDNFLRLRHYVQKLERGELEHPSGRSASRKGACAIPIAGIHGEGVDKIIEVVVDMLD